MLEDDDLAKSVCGFKNNKKKMREKDTSFCSQSELLEMGFKSVGKNVQISRKASLYGIPNISIGDNVRIDDFCVISAGDNGIFIGDHVHIAIYTSIQGMGKVVLEDFVSISSKITIYSSNDDYSGASLTNPTIPDEFKNVQIADVILKKHVIIASNSVILPGVCIGEGAVVGAFSLVKNDLDPFGIYVGVPVQKIKERSKELLEKERLFYISKTN